MRFNAYVWASIVLILIAFFLTVFPVANYFFSKYIHLKHSIEKGSYFIYVGILPLIEYIPEGGRQYGFVLHVEALNESSFLLNMTVYRLEGGQIGYDAKRQPVPFAADKIDLMFSEAVNTTYNDSPLLKFIMSREIRKEDANETYTIKSLNLFGFPKGYEYLKSSSFKEYIDFDEYLFLTSANLQSTEEFNFIISQFPSVNSLIEERMRSGAENFSLPLFITGGNTVPSEQDWLGGIWFVFGLMIFPVPIILMATAIIVLIIGIRKGW
jgi:hypothetical protein